MYGMLNEMAVSLSVLDAPGLNLGLLPHSEWSKHPSRTQRKDEPVSTMTLSFCGGVPISTSARYAAPESRRLG
jgi:hypothetical protein